MGVLRGGRLRMCVCEGGGTVWALTANPFPQWPAQSLASCRALHTHNENNTKY